MANFNFNKVILGGRLTADPELKTTQSGIAVVSFSVAVNRRYTKNSAQQNETDFFNVTGSLVDRNHRWLSQNYSVFLRPYSYYRRSKIKSDYFFVHTLFFLLFIYQKIRFE